MLAKVQRARETVEAEEWFMSLFRGVRGEKVSFENERKGGKDALLERVRHQRQHLLVLVQ
jgi:hypothetical protein